MSKVFCLPEYKNGTKQRRSVEMVESFYLIEASRNTYILLFIGVLQWCSTDVLYLQSGGKCSNGPTLWSNFSPSLTISWVWNSSSTSSNHAPGLAVQNALTPECHSNNTFSLNWSCLFINVYGKFFSYFFITLSYQSFKWRKDVE